MQFAELLEVGSDTMTEDIGSAKKADSFLWPDIFKKWEACNERVENLLKDIETSQNLVFDLTGKLTSRVQLFKIGSLWRKVVSSFNSTLFLLEQFITTVYKHISLQWGKDFCGLPLCDTLMESIQVFNKSCKLLNESPCLIHLQPIVLGGKFDSYHRFISKWDSKESRLRNLQINGTVVGRPSTNAFNLSKMLSIIARKRAQGAVLAMTWSLSPFMQCQTIGDLDSFALLLKECDDLGGVKSGCPNVDSSDQLSLLDQTSDVLEFSPLKEFMRDEEESLDQFLGDTVSTSHSFIAPLGKVLKNGEVKVSRYRKLSIWLHYVEQLWKHVTYSVEEILIWDTRWAGYHLPLVTKDVSFSKHLKSILQVVQTHIEGTLPSDFSHEVTSSKEVSAKHLASMSETDLERGKSLLNAVKILGDSIGLMTSWQEVDSLYLQAQLLHYQRATETDGTGIHNVLAGERGIQFFNPFIFDIQVPKPVEGDDNASNDALQKIYLLLTSLTVSCEVYSYAVESLLWDSLTSWDIVKYLDISQHSLPMICEKLACIKPLDKMDKDLQASEVINVKIWVMTLGFLETHYKNVLAELKKTTDNSFTMFVKFCERICLNRAEELLPKGTFWRKQHRPPRGPSFFVPPLVVAVLQPVIDGLKNLSESSQSLIGQEIVKAVCHGILDVILKYEIKFNLCGAMQLQQDFNCIKTWIHNHPVLSASTKDEIAANDVFLECEGVTRLLMRQRDWFSSLGRNQVVPGASRRNSLHPLAGSIPPEMYVIHQHLWLNLRVSSDHCLGPFCS